MYQLGYTLTPAPDLSASSALSFQAQLAVPERGITFQQTQHVGTALVLTRAQPPLTVQIIPLAVAQAPAQAPSVSQIGISSSPPAGTPDDYLVAARDVLQAYSAVWGAPGQIIQRECRVHYLFDTGQEHAFQYLWEQRLHQERSALDAFGRPILGGGLRFVIPAREGTDEPLIDARIESYLPNSKQLFVEVAAKWGPAASAAFSPELIFHAATEYVDNSVIAFLQSGT